MSDKLWSVYVSSEAAANDELRALVRAMSAAVGLDLSPSSRGRTSSRGRSTPGFKSPLNLDGSYSELIIVCIAYFKALR